MGSTTTAKLADAPAFDGRGIPATFARSEVEDALAADGDVALRLEISRRADGADDFEAHTLEIAWDRSELEGLLEKTSGDAVTLTFDAGQLADAMDADVEAHDLRERVLVLTVAAATAAAGSAGYLVTSQHHQAAPTPQAYVYSSAPSELVTDAPTGGYVAPDTAAAPAAGYVHSAAPIEQVSDVASTGGGYAEAAPAAGYVHSAAPVEQVSDVASSGGGYTQAAELQSDAATGGYAEAAPAAGYVHSAAPVEQVSDVASSGGGYTQAAELQSDAATGGYAQPEQAAGYVHSSAPIEQVSDVASTGGGYSESAPAAGYVHSSAPIEQTSDVASSGGGYASEVTASGTSATSAGGGVDVPAGVIAGGIALLITGAAFVTGRGRFTRPPRPA